MKRGIAIVKYDCSGLTVLSDCAVDGEYRYQGLSKHTGLEQAFDTREISLKLPLTGQKMSARIGAGLTGDNALNIGMITIGEFRIRRDPEFRR